MKWHIVDIICLISAVGTWLAQVYFGMTIGGTIPGTEIVERKKRPMMFWGLMAAQAIGGGLLFLLFNYRELFF